MKHWASNLWFIAPDTGKHIIIADISCQAVFWFLFLFTRKYNLPLFIVSLFSLAVNFAVCSFYEIVQLWVSVYKNKQTAMNYNTVHDLQNDLIGSLSGLFFALLTYYIWILLQGWFK